MAKLPPQSIETQEYRVLQSIDASLKVIVQLLEAPSPALSAILTELKAQTPILQKIADDLAPELETPTAIQFQETSMNPTQAGQTQVFTGTLTPAGAVFPADSTFSVTSNDPAVSPTVDSTGLVVSVTYPDGWVESTTTPLAFAYAATSLSTGMSLSATITPSAPPAIVPTGITFAQTA